MKEVPILIYAEGFLSLCSLQLLSTDFCPSAASSDSVPSYCDLQQRASILVTSKRVTIAVLTLVTVTLD